MRLGGKLNQLASEPAMHLNNIEYRASSYVLSTMVSARVMVRPE